MLYVIQPVDNYFFGTPQPFEAGGETAEIKSVFPPLPSAYAGAFRRYVAKGGGVNRIRIGFNGLWLKDKLYLPAPHDVVQSDGTDGGRCTVRTMALVRKPLSSYPLDYMLCEGRNGREEEIQKKENIKKKRNLYLAESEMNEYLAANSQKILCTDINEEYIVREKKLGIEVNPGSGTSKKKMIYQTECVRTYHGLKLVVDIESDLLQQKGVIKLGGESKMATFCQTDHELAFHTEALDSHYFKLYLASPAIFRNGWLPGWVDERTKTGYFNYKNRYVRVKLLAASVGSRISCGGFGYDKKKGRLYPRELRYAVPAGSVYYFKLLQGTFKDAVKLFHQKCLSEYRENMGFDYQIFNRSRYCDRGFGYSLVGRLTKEQEEMVNV